MALLVFSLSHKNNIRDLQQRIAHSTDDIALQRFMQLLYLLEKPFEDNSICGSLINNIEFNF